MTRLLQSMALAIVLTIVMGACSDRGSGPTGEATSTPIPPTRVNSGDESTADPATASTGGGEPRSTSYWLLWNSCAPDNRAETARTNGGRAAGWIILDDLLADPGVLIGEMEVTTCAQGVALLQQQAVSGEDRSSDPAYGLAAQLFTAQLNLAAGAASCPAAEQAVQAAQLLLLSLDFQGTGTYLTPDSPNPRDRALAGELADILARYNAGALCVA